MGYAVCTGSYYSHMALIGTSCVKCSHDVHEARVSTDTSTNKSSSISLSNGKKCELFVDYFSRSAFRIAVNLAVSSWAYSIMYS